MFSAEEHVQPGMVFEVILNRETGESFGLNIVGGTDSREFGNNTSIFISSINSHGPAASCKQLDVGDRILQIDDKILNDVTHSEAVEAFRNSGLSVKLRVEKFAQQLFVANLSETNISNTTISGRIRNFVNSWAGALLIGTTTGIVVMYTISKHWKLNLK
ncbi:synaptojanin-2-binding protein-like [Xenia sp. Carnegie-2017]|uniref:synaptojanin-2-binding protein-like n=1 Tax=Xenia sp. Carnegie-2017 TaxID=2897299 RepID=UPI001F04FB21|nr:synaptojanin-2-binding protein-like [Xenia sp. Carnegie-2017]